VRTPPDPLIAEAVSPFSDEEIVKRVLEGDTAVFELIVRRYNQRLFRATRAILRDDGEAEDVMQEAYVRAFVNLDQFAGDAKFSTWLTKIAVYEALGRLRRAKRQEDLPETMDSSDNPERTAYGRELQSAIESAVDALPPLYRTVFVLREVEEMSVAETAGCLGITEESVKTRCHRARAFLRSRLERIVGLQTRQAFSFLGHRCDRVTQRVMERIHAAGRDSAV
jgi:RNA polymerase sigma-70 factor (ECF subfamily)